MLLLVMSVVRLSRPILLHNNFCELCNVSFVEIWLQIIIQQYRINQLPLTLNIVHEQVFYCFPYVDTLYMYLKNE